MSKMLNDFEGNIHPVVRAVQKGGNIDKVNITGDWFDDHCPCLSIELTVDGVVYEYEDWWLSSAGQTMYIRSECEGAKAEDARTKLKGHIIGSLDG